MGNCTQWYSCCIDYLVQKSIIMKTQDFKNNHHTQGNSTADRAFTDQRKNQKQTGINNSGGQPSFTTSTKNSAHKPQHKKD
jgi:hypothetical protein